MKELKLNLLLLILLLFTCHIEGGVVTSDAYNEDCVTENNNNNETCKALPRHQDEEWSCQFYLAPSSIPNAGFGVYTTKAITGDTVLKKADAPSIMVYDTNLHFPNKLWSMDNYFWSGEGSGQFECASVEELVVNFGTSCNYHTYLKNVYPVEVAYNDTITPRAEGSPGIGAYSYQGGVEFIATRDINAGEEIFADYGEDWLEERSKFQSVPREDDFLDTAEILEVLANGLKVGSIDDTFMNIIRGVVNVFNEPRISSLLPRTKEKLSSFVSSLNGELDEDNIAYKLSYDHLLSRDIDWIKSNGQCLDILQQKLSTIPHAGRGAFSQTFIAKGETVIIAPLLHLMDSDSTYIYPLDFDDNGKPSRNDDNDDFIGRQLITNYCFGHDESSMLLCPQTNALLINHCSTRYDYGGDCAKYNKNDDSSLRGANAFIRWSDWDVDTKSWLNMTMDEIVNQVKRGKRGLSFEVVASRDIYPGDEVFIDYGEEWDNDWKDHVLHWEAPDVDDYIPITEMTKRTDEFRTLDELDENPYPSNVMTACHYQIEQDEEYDDDTKYVDDPEVWITDGSKIAAAAENEIKRNIYYWPCNVLSRERHDEGHNIYEVEILQSQASDAIQTSWHHLGFRRIMKNFTKNGIMFMPQPYSIDQHQPGVFRSSIRIPDELFPDQWKDRSGK